jgi:hypothetical protein
VIQTNPPFSKHFWLKNFQIKVKILIFRSNFGIPLKNEAQQHSWAKICKVIWEIPVKFIHAFRIRDYSNCFNRNNDAHIRFHYQAVWAN